MPIEPVTINRAPSRSERVMHKVRSTATGEVLVLSPVSAREHVASGAYEFVLEPDDTPNA